jgi:hypothetical protein
MQTLPQGGASRFDYGEFAESILRAAEFPKRKKASLHDGNS